MLKMFQFSSVQFSRSVMSDSLWPPELQHIRPPCPSPTPGVHSDSRPLSRWCPGTYHISHVSIQGPLPGPLHWRGLMDLHEDKGGALSKWPQTWTQEISRPLPQLRPRRDTARFMTSLADVYFSDLLKLISGMCSCLSGAHLQSWM